MFYSLKTEEQLTSDYIWIMGYFFPEQMHLEETYVPRYNYITAHNDLEKKLK